MQQIDLAEFIETQHQALEAFKAHWIAMRSNPHEGKDRWPLSNQKGDWDEQLAAFLGGTGF